jgi:hypothetical protein
MINTISKQAYRILTHPLREDEKGWFSYETLHTPGGIPIDVQDTVNLLDGLNQHLYKEGRDPIDDRTPFVVLSNRFIDRYGYMVDNIKNSFLFNFSDKPIRDGQISTRYLTEHDSAENTYQEFSDSVLLVSVPTSRHTELDIIGGKRIIAEDYKLKVIQIGKQPIPPGMTDNE